MAVLVYSNFLITRHVQRQKRLNDGSSADFPQDLAIHQSQSLVTVVLQLAGTATDTGTDTAKAALELQFSHHSPCSTSKEAQRWLICRLSPGPQNNRISKIGVDKDCHGQSNYKDAVIGQISNEN
jgi:hypothetical protein